MKRYIAQYVPWTGGLYAVLDTIADRLISDPKPYHEANDEAHERNNGTFDLSGFSGWMAALPDKP